MRQIINGEAITYSLDLAAPLVTVLAEYGIRNTQYVYGQGDSPLASYDGAGWTYLSGRDGLNSVRQETDAAGNVIAARSFDPYGVPMGEDGGSPFGYTGEMRDEATGLVFLRARMYQPQLGIFLSRDPVLTSSPYRYASGNPINRVDPSGYIDWQACVTQGGSSTCKATDGDGVWPIARQINDVIGTPGNEQVVAEIATFIITSNSIPAPYDLKYGQLLVLPAEWVEPLKAYYQPAPAPTPWLPPVIHPGAPALPSLAPSLPGMPNGYIEGRLYSFTDFFCPIWLHGEEVVYDFAAMPPQRARFTYKVLVRSGGNVGVGGLSTSQGDLTLTEYVGLLWGFARQGSVNEYSNEFLSWTIGGSLSIPGLPGFVSPGTGAVLYSSPNGSLYGGGWYGSIGINIFPDSGDYGASFSMIGSTRQDLTEYGNERKVSYVDLGRLAKDIWLGVLGRR